MISHWTQISLYFCYETNLGMQNDESATKIDVGSFCNQNLALRHTESRKKQKPGKEEQQLCWATKMAQNMI